MSHYHCEVWIKDLADVDAAVTAAMEPHRENWDEEAAEYSGWWDWWQIGGRWTGTKGTYDPTKDPANVEVCDLCDGTGMRRDVIGRNARAATPSYTCNACGTFDRESNQWTHGPQGPGKRVKLPGSWVRNFGDVVPVAEIEETLEAYRLLLPEVNLAIEKWCGDTWIKDWDGKVKAALERNGITTGYLVTVDYHS